MFEFMQGCMWILFGPVAHGADVSFRARSHRPRNVCTRSFEAEVYCQIPLGYRQVTAVTFHKAHTWEQTITATNEISSDSSVTPRVH